MLVPKFGFVSLVRAYSILSASELDRILVMILCDVVLILEADGHCDRQWAMFLKKHRLKDSNAGI